MQRHGIYSMFTYIVHVVSTTPEILEMLLISVSSCIIIILSANKDEILTVAMQ